ncbi:MFS transporter, SET family, sugar efflux transporter [Monaibacterium marinum]|uniref:MFS transporter, SET family, sugar efflux transporter n=1 Tax=Pontivivens marinum TaxID=1690039 RepID=A0A2C9CSK0_9RHOB|nr:MFS transporter [Monaibacterium marinum]SOH94198.1 MFS transporter, SET family, sugar efflux transporter [Monaibacterium marinum]
MPSSNTTARLSFLLLLFCGTVCSAMIVPFMGYFLVQGLGYQPWIISVYSVMAVCLTLLANRQFAQRIDNGARAFPLVGIAAAGFMMATIALSLFPTLWTVLSVGVIGFGISSSAISTMFSLGGGMAEQHGIARSRFNAYMRATTSTGWMIGPAATFLIADQIGLRAVFVVALSVALLWVALWWWTLPRDVTAQAKPAKGSVAGASRDLWLAASFVFCLSLAHSLTFSSLPLFYVQEVGLPGYAPGVAFSIKTFVEVIAIFATPMIIARFGMRRALLATTLLAVVTIQVLASVETFAQMFVGAAMEGLYYGFYASLGISYVQSFAQDRPAQATAIYWNTLMVSGLLAGPAVGFIAQSYDFQMVVRVASGVALFAAIVLLISRKKVPQVE